MFQTLHVDVSNYDIEISDNKLESLISDIKTFVGKRKFLIVISKKVYKLYHKILKLEKQNILILPDGEKEKNFKNYIKIISKASEIGLNRSDMIIALGGGVIGDLAGYAASTYMRGIEYIQVPTTLLSMVDSSVGGKTAIDMDGAKNIVGTFYQPAKVFININFIKTLDKKQLMSGLGEVLKYAFIEENCNLEHSIFLYEYLTLCCEKMFNLEPITLVRIIEYCLKCKIAVVNKDEKEESLRKILNLGHTMAHALEAITKYRKYTHGEAVVEGMFFVFEMAYQMDLISYSYKRLSTELLEKYHFVNRELWKKYPANAIITAMKKDKKATAEKITFIIPCGKKQVKEVKLYPKEVEKYLK